MRSGSVSYQGPVPPPEIIADYADIDPSFPDRILKLSENNLEHQYEVRNKLIRLKYLGWFSSTTVTLVALGLGAWLLANDKDVGGFCLLLGSALPSVLVFFKEKSQKS